MFKRLAVLEFQTILAVGINPDDEGISAAKKVLKASEYDGMKVIKFRIRRFDPNKLASVTYYFVGVENLDIVVT